MLYHRGNNEGDPMKEEIQKTFDNYLEQFREDENVCEQIKKTVLEQVGLGDELTPVIQRFLNIAQEQEYAYAVPLGYAMMFL